jgi:regulator of sirC expression with transglutaminase-like and TPR domain
VAEIEAIARLLADPDPGIATALRRQLALRPEDPAGLREAVEALEDPLDRARARDARLEVGRERAQDRLLRLAGGADPSLEEGAFEISRLEDPDTDVAGARRKLDELASKLRGLLEGDPETLAPLVAAPRGPTGRREKISVLAWFLAEREGFEGEREEYDSPRNSILPEVLARKRGLPIALSVVYLLVAARAGIELFGVGAPLHFLVGGPTETRPLYLDPFHKGRILEAEAVADFLRGLDVAFRPEHLAPTASRKILARMARNLVAYHARKPRGETRARRLQRIALAFEAS